MIRRSQKQTQAQAGASSALRLLHPSKHTRRVEGEQQEQHNAARSKLLPASRPPQDSSEQSHQTLSRRTNESSNHDELIFISSSLEYHEPLSIEDEVRCEPSIVCPPALCNAPLKSEVGRALPAAWPLPAFPTNLVAAFASLVPCWSLTLLIPPCSPSSS